MKLPHVSIFILTTVLVACQTMDSSAIVSEDSQSSSMIEESSSISESSLTSSEQNKLEAQAILYEEGRKSFQFFWETTNQNVNSTGYGMSRDRYPGNPSIASIASVGFALAAIPYGVQRGYITHEQGYERVDRTLTTLQNLPRTNGFYFHFVNMVTGAREWQSEVSIIDTGLMLAGAIVAGEFFGGTILEKVNDIYLGVNWNWYVNDTLKMFYMGYIPETGFSGRWDHFAEQMILYVLAAGHPGDEYGATLYRRIKFVESSQSFAGYLSTVTGERVDPFIYSYDGSLFQHQFSHAFIDFRKVLDYQGTDWFENARRATRANYLYTIDNASRFKTYSENSWGISASDGPNEYRAYGAMPAKNNTHNGTIAPYAAVASINYWEEEVLAAVKHYATIPQINKQYGLTDAYNLGPVEASSNPTLAAITPWYGPDVLGIDKGISALMIANYQSELIWSMFMQNSFVQTGLEKLGFTNR